MDLVVSAVTHRTLHSSAKPLPPAGARQPQHSEQPQQAAAAAERVGSRLGVPLAAAAADSQAGSEATPGAPLSAQPSTQSLQGLLGGPGSAAEVVGAASRAPADGSGGAARAALAAQQTVERRRLDLDALGSPRVVLTSAGMHRQQQLAVSSSDGEEEEGVAGGGGGGAAGDEPSSAPHSSALGGADSQQRPSRGGSDTGLACVASVELINAPLGMEESEQAELLS